MSIYKPAIPAKGYLGYYEIPNFPKYCINKSGRIFSKKKNTCINGFDNVRGYRCYSIINDNQKKVMVMRHRLLCIVFKNNVDNPSKYQVNHIDGIPGSDALENLEFCTAIENIRHAARLGKMGKLCPVQTRCVTTGRITTFRSLKSCAEKNNISEDLTRYRCKRGHVRIFPDLKQYRFSCDDDWPRFTPPEVTVKLLENSTNKSILIKNLFTGIVEKFICIKDLCTKYGFKQSTISVWCKDGNQKVVTGGYLIKYEINQSPWKEFESSREMYQTYQSENPGYKLIEVTDECGRTYTYWRASQAAMDNNLSVTSLNYRLSTPDDTIFSDNKQYMYFK